MVPFLLIVAIASLILVILFLVSPQTVRDLSDKLNKTISFIDEKLFAYRLTTGISLIIVSIFIFLCLYYFTRT